MASGSFVAGIKAQRNGERMPGTNPNPPKALAKCEATHKAEQMKV